ncbi:MAG: YkgJ family cysteine cluster protein [Phycisphaerales bacterium]|nr:YkgJ family cysteine cluster protein [Phycisphaerales bacterium]
MSWTPERIVTKESKSSEDSVEREWYRDGLRFACTQCGNCCTGPPGAVWFTEQEGLEMAKAMGLKPRAFRDQYARKLNDGWSLNEHLTESGYDCIFLDRKTEPGKALCGIYGARPRQCRTWPFWTENLRSPEDWARARRSTPCPGMDQGKVVPIEQIRIQRDKTP